MAKEYNTMARYQGAEAGDPEVDASYHLIFNGNERTGSESIFANEIIDDVRTIIIKASGLDLSQQEQNTLMVFLVHKNHIQNLSTDAGVNTLMDATHYDQLAGNATLYVATKNHMQNMALFV